MKFTLQFRYGDEAVWQTLEDFDTQRKALDAYLAKLQFNGGWEERNIDAGVGMHWQLRVVESKEVTRTVTETEEIELLVTKLL